jgi:hypothetical protein
VKLGKGDKIALTVDIQIQIVRYFAQECLPVHVACSTRDTGADEQGSVSIAEGANEFP